MSDNALKDAYAQVAAAARTVAACALRLTTDPHDSVYLASYLLADRDYRLAVEALHKMLKK